MPPRNDDANALVGRVLGGKYRLAACIGVGATGTVYRADQIALGRTVAVKILSAELAANTRIVKRFHDEALAASRLNHPNVVSIIDYGQSEDHLLYLVMEHLRGPTVTQLIAREHPLPLARVLDIIVQILSGIEEAHLAGVVHADLKSDNVIVDQRRAGAYAAKIVDFGIARLMHAPRDGDDRNVCGTPEYMAPEVITGAQPGFAADIYAVGVMLFELLTAQTPFFAATTMEILHRQVKAMHTPPSQLRPDLPVGGSIDAVVARALAKSPRDRFRDAAAMRESVIIVASRLAALEQATDIECPSCGASCAASFRFCPECGHPSGGAAKTLEFAALDPPAPGGAADVPLVGREAQLASIRDHLRSGRGGMWITGPHGSGRSRTVAEACTQAADLDAESGLAIYQIEPDPMAVASTSTFYPIRAVIAAALDLPPVLTSEELYQALSQLGLSDADWFGVVHLFGHDSPLLELEPPLQWREMLHSTLRLLSACADRSPMAIVFDDVDRYDLPSLEFIRNWIERLQSRLSGRAIPIVLIGDAGDHIRWLDSVPKLLLPPLSTDEVGAAADQLSGIEASELPSPRELTALCHGVPGHLAHLLRFVGVGGRLDTQDQPLADLIAARLALLPHSTLRVCQAAAVVGYEVAVEVLSAMGLGDGAESALRIAADHGLVTVDEYTLRFPDSMVRDIAYAATPLDVRRTLHKQAADTLQGAGAEAAVVGHHLMLAEAWAAAVPFLAQAGDAAARLLDEDGAVRLFQRALHCVRALVHRGETDSGAMSLFVVISAKLADALRSRGDSALARGILAEARPWADSPMLEARLDRSAAVLLYRENETDGAALTLRRAIGKAISVGDMALVIDAYLDLAAGFARLGELAAADHELAECVDIVTFGEGATSRTAPSNMWTILVRRAQLRLALGDTANALTLAEAALMQARRCALRLGTARTQVLVAKLYEAVGRQVEAGRLRTSALKEMRSLGDRRSTAELLISELNVALEEPIVRAE